MRLLPQEVYGDEAHVESLQDAVGAQAKKAQAAQDELFLEIRLSTASKWGLALFERDYGLSEEKELAAGLRRARIRTKRKGQGVTTCSLLTGVCEDFTGGKCVLHELYTSYKIWIALSGTDEKPKNLGLMTNTIREILPAHLDFGYRFVFDSVAPNTEYMRPVSLRIICRINNYLTRPVRFDGEADFNGEIDFNQQVTGQFTARRACFHIGVKNDNNLTGQLITSTLYRADGTKRFNGTRRFNAEIKREVL